MFGSSLIRISYIIFLHGFIFHLSFILFEHKNKNNNATVVVPVVCDNGQSSFVLFVKSYVKVLHSFELTSFVLSMVWSNTISTGFLAITAKKLSFYLGEKLLPMIWLFFFINLKSLYESYLPLSTLFLIFSIIQFETNYLRCHLILSS